MGICHTHAPPPILDHKMADTTQDLEQLFAERKDLLDDISSEVYKAEMKRLPIYGWIQDLSFSHKRLAVYVKENHAIVSCRGTKGCKDWLCNIVLCCGCMRCTKVYVDDLNLVNKLQESKKFATIILTGHSRGGTTAIGIARKLDLPACVFNPGSGCASCFETIGDHCSHSCCHSKHEAHDERVYDAFRVKIIRTKKDLVSLFYISAFVVENHEGTQGFAHSMSNFE